MHTSLVFAMLAVVSACVQPPVKTVTPTPVYVSDSLGLVFSLPVDWGVTAQPWADIFSGPQGTPAYYTTIVLQRRPAMALEDALESELQSVAALPRFAAPSSTPDLVDGHPAIAYTLQFELQEMLRQKTGLFFRQHGCVVDLSYNAPSDLFALSVPVFQDVLDSITLGPDDK